MSNETKKAPAKKQAAPEPARAEADQAAALLEAAEAFETTYAEAIQARVAAGLTREQAIAVQREQVRRDLEIA